MPKTITVPEDHFDCTLRHVNLTKTNSSKWMKDPLVYGIRSDIKEWLDAETHGYHVRPRTAQITFKREEDAILYKVAWF